MVQVGQAAANYPSAINRLLKVVNLGVCVIFTLGFSYGIFLKNNMGADVGVKYFVFFVSFVFTLPYVLVLRGLVDPLKRKVGVIIALTLWCLFIVAGCLVQEQERSTIMICLFLLAFNLVNVFYFLTYKNVVRKAEDIGEK